MAGGSGRRMGSALPKQFLMLHSRPVLAHTIDRMHEALPAARIVVVLPEEHIPLWRNLAARFDIARHEVTAGGSERFHSVANGLAALGDGVRLIAVHDGVRPLASKKLILRALLEAEKSGAAIPVVAPADSYRIIDGETSHPIDRSRLRIVQTPQVFDAALLRSLPTAILRRLHRRRLGRGGRRTRRHPLRGRTREYKDNDTFGSRHGRSHTKCTRR